MRARFPALALTLLLAACSGAPGAYDGTGSSSSSSMAASSSTAAATSSAMPEPGPADVDVGGVRRYDSPQGFSIDLPVATLIAADVSVPVAAYEDPDKTRVFVAAAEYDDPTTPDVDRIPTTLDALRGPHASRIPHWTMDVTEIADDAALETWVHNHYGPGCTIAEKAPTAQRDVMDVLLEGDGLSLEETRCVLNYAYEIRYQPSKGRVLSWELGQAPSFNAPDGSGADDLRMRDSVRMR